jgi:tetrahydromethanopterin S-methyltransferase subunit C
VTLAVVGFASDSAFRLVLIAAGLIGWYVVFVDRWPFTQRKTASVPSEPSARVGRNLLLVAASLNVALD